MSTASTEEGKPQAGSVTSEAMPRVPARKTRGPRKSTLQALEAARREGYRMGYEEGLDAGRPPMIGLVIWSAICGLLGAAAGETLF